MKLVLNDISESWNSLLLIDSDHGVVASRNIKKRFLNKYYVALFNKANDEGGKASSLSKLTDKEFFSGSSDKSFLDIWRDIKKA